MSGTIAMVKAKSKQIEHQVKDIGIDIIDQYECSCGWKSKSYYDGREWAWEEFERHLEEVK